MTTAVRVEARITDLRRLAGGVVEVRLEADQAPHFLPGQYLQILTPGTDSGIPFSIASAPAELPAITLHYLAQAGSDDARRMDAILSGSQRVDLLMPAGECGFQPPLTRPLLALAGGSGIAQVRSLLRALLPAAVPFRLYWGAATPADLYLSEELDALARRHPEFEWVAVAETPGNVGGVRRGRVADAVIADIEHGELQLADWQVLLAGGPPMVWGTVGALIGVGLRREQTSSDVFAYAPRDDVWPRDP